MCVHRWRKGSNGERIRLGSLSESPKKLSRSARVWNRREHRKSESKKRCVSLHGTQPFWSEKKWNKWPLAASSEGAWSRIEGRRSESRTLWVYLQIAHYYSLWKGVVGTSHESECDNSRYSVQEKKGWFERCRCLRFGRSDVSISELCNWFSDFGSCARIWRWKSRFRATIWCILQFLAFYALESDGHRLVHDVNSGDRDKRAILDSCFLCFGCEGFKYLTYCFFHRPNLLLCRRGIVQILSCVLLVVQWAAWCWDNVSPILSTWAFLLPLFFRPRLLIWRGGSCI